MFGFLFELSLVVVHPEAGVSGDRGVESSEGENGLARRAQRKSLMQRFEAEVGSVNTYHHALKHSHC